MNDCNGILFKIVMKSELLLYLLLGDVRLDELLQNPTVVDVSTATGAQRHVSLRVTKHTNTVSVSGSVPRASPETDFTFPPPVHKERPAL